MEMTGMMGSFFKISEWLMKFFLANLLWLLFNFPIVYLGLSMIFVQSSEELYLLIIIVLLLLPFIFFPATTAMFAVVRMWIIGGKERHLLYLYWKYYKENYIRSLAGGFIFVLLSILWIVNYNLAMVEVGSGLFYFFIAFTMFLTAFLNYFFADTVHYELKLFQSLRKALFMAIFQVHYTLGAAAAAGICLYITYTIHPLFLLLFSGSIVAYIYFFAFHQIYLRAQEVSEAKSA